MIYVALFFIGAFLCNSIPHLVAGLQGRPFPSPFAKPPGKGDSSPLVNFLWGFFNLLVGLFLFSRNPVAIGLNADFLVAMLGVLMMGIHASLHFGKVQREKAGK